MSEIIVIEGVAFVLPRYEGIGAARKVGPLAVFAHCALDRFGIGLQALEAGLMLQIGPLYVGLCHINRQQAAFDRLNPPSSSSETSSDDVGGGR